MKISVYIIVILLILIGCESRGDALKTKWKCLEGNQFGDFLDFENENIAINSYTIYINSLPFAILVRLEKTYVPGTENKLTLKNIETGKLSLYTDKGK